MLTLTPSVPSSLHSLVFAGLSDGVLVFDAHARLLDLNAAACALLGIDKRSIGQPADTLLADWSRLTAQLDEAQAINSSSVYVESRAGWLELTLTPLAEGGSLVQLRDVSAHKTAEYKLQTEYAESEAKYRRLIEDAGDVIYTIDTAGYFTFANAAATRLTEYRSEDYIGMHFLKLVRRDYRDEIMLFYMQQLQTNEMTSYFEFPLVSRSGKEYWMGQTVQLVRQDGQISGMQAVARDITDRIRAEQALLRRTAELESAYADLEQFSFIAAHDLQEPLRKIQAFGSRLERSCAAALNPKGKDYLNRMLGSSRRLSLLIEDLLAFSQLGRGAAQPDICEAVNLNTVARSVLLELAQRYDLSAVTIELSDLPTLQAEPGQMRLLLLHLLDNALKFRRPDVAPRVVLGSSQTETSLVLSVADNGIGFDEQYSVKVFEVFQRLHHRDAVPGNGMGLALCRRIAVSHGGDIVVSSVVGGGSTFSVRFPKTLVMLGDG